MANRPFGLAPDRMSERQLLAHVRRCLDLAAAPVAGQQGIRDKLRAKAEGHQCIQELLNRGVQTTLMFGSQPEPHWKEAGR